jgi:hypothetical protein
MTTARWTSGFVALTLLLPGAARGDGGPLRATVSDGAPWLATIPASRSTR